MSTVEQTVASTQSPLQEPVGLEGRRRGPGRLSLLRPLVADWRSRLGLLLVGFFVLLAVVGPFVFPGDPTAADYTLPPNSPPGAAHWLGTDQGGKDMFLQLVHGAMPSLVVGFSVGLAATALSALVGMTAGFFGGGTDNSLTLLTNVFLLIPGLPLVIVMASYIEGDSNWPIIAILALTGWAFGARILRSQALSLKSRDFVLAAVARGENRLRIVVSEILPNMISMLAAIFIGSAAGAIAAMAGLQFLGLGDMNQVNWFTTLYWAQNYGSVLTGAWWTFVPSGLAIALLVTGLSLINYGIDAISNPRLREVSPPRLARRAAPVPRAAHPAEAPLLSVSDLVVDYETGSGPVRAVDGVSFELSRGEVLGLAGESGCGKSTIVNALLQLAKTPTTVSGAVTFDGVDLLALDEPRMRSLRWRRISLVSQSSMNALSPVRTVGSHFVDTIRAHHRIPREQCLARAAEYLAMVGIDSGRLGSYPHQLSGGMRQRVMIALALVLDPDLIIMDEPTTALDVVIQKEILQQVAVLRERLGFSIIFITHDLSLLLEISDTIGIMYAGKVAEIAPAKEIMTTARHPYTRMLLASFPSLDLAADDELAGIAGAPPNPRAYPSGCRFHPRCPAAMGECGDHEPDLLLRDGQLFACHLVTADAPIGRTAHEGADA